jgi:tetraacyldisaccharide 4'-kinase
LAASFLVRRQQSQNLAAKAASTGNVVFHDVRGLEVANWLQGLWYRPSPWHALLLPLSLLFGLLAALRRGLYRARLLQSVKLPVPVVVVGNIAVGGTGKTPLVLWLAHFLRERGWRPGIISRGYGASTAQPHAVTPDGDPLQSGDEPLLLARRSGCPVWVGRDRAATGRALLKAHPDCNVLLCDDGLQHYRLRRDVEIAVIDGARGCGNGFLLPAGPLREGVKRLQTVDAVVVNGGTGQGSHAMTLSGTLFRNLADASRTAQAQDFRGLRLHAVAGIGNPQRFFDHLRGLGLECATRAFPDHHAYRAEDLAFAGTGPLLMTEKDAVKCADFAKPNWWALAVEAQVDAALGERLLEKLRKTDGCQTA